jgi:hypothetical protein
VSDEKRRISAAKLDEEPRQTNEAIGAFVFAFSQLEFTIRVRLARVFGVRENMADIVTGLRLRDAVRGLTGGNTGKETSEQEA